MRILAVNHTQSLLMDGVEILLAKNGHWIFDVIRTTTDDIADLIQEVERYRPNIVIIEGIHPFVNPADLFTKLLDMGKVQLAVVNINNNKLDIYDKSEFTISGPDHFIETLNWDKQMVR